MIKLLACWVFFFALISLVFTFQAIADPVQLCDGTNCVTIYPEQGSGDNYYQGYKQAEYDYLRDTAPYNYGSRSQYNWFRNKRIQQYNQDKGRFGGRYKKGGGYRIDSTGTHRY